MYTTIERLLQDVRDAADYETGKQRADALIGQYKRQLASATAALADDLEASLTHLKLPVLHRRMVRTTNLCESAFGEQRRRSKVTPRSSAVQLGVTPCNTRATPCYAVT
jgi:transposase-like protein